MAQVRQAEQQLRTYDANIKIMEISRVELLNNCQAAKQITFENGEPAAREHLSRRPQGVKS